MTGLFETVFMGSLPHSNSLRGVELFNLTGRSAVITGGSKGLGYAMAAGLASCGADVMLVSRHEEEARRAAEKIRADFGSRAVPYQADITLETEVCGMVAAADAAFGKIDILINSAGINIRAPILEMTLDQFSQVMTTNVNGTWLCCRAVIAGMRERKWGRIINLASALSLVGLANRTPYTASKGAVLQMTRTLALECSADGITVNAISPGPFLTEMNEAIANTEDGQKFVVGATALKRWGRLEEIQGAGIFLASEASSYMTGANLVVDGGWTAQ